MSSVCPFHEKKNHIMNKKGYISANGKNTKQSIDTASSYSHLSLD